MPKYRKKPVVIEAIRFTNFNRKEIETFVGKKLLHQVESDTAYEAGVAAPISSLTIPTLEGDMKAVSGDWVIKGIAGEFYPCKNDIFLGSYEPIE